MDMNITFKQIDNSFIDLSISKKFVEHYNKSNSYSKYIIENEINVGMYDDFIFNKIFNEKLTVIDAGANVGLFSLYFLPKIKKIYCIEPTKTHFEILKDLLSKFDDKKIEYHNIALSNKNEILNFEINNFNTTENKLTNKETCDKVTGKTLKNFFIENNIDQIDLLKLDIEGGENDVLMNDNTVDEILLKCKYIYVETHPAPYGNIIEEKLISKMEKLNFQHIQANRTFAHWFIKQ